MLFIPNINPVEQIMLSKKFAPLRFIVHGINGKNLQPLVFKRLVNIGIQLRNKHIAVRAVGLVNHYQRVFCINLMQVYIFTIETLQCKVGSSFSNEVIFSKKHIFANFLQRLFRGPECFARQVIFPGNVHKQGIHSHNVAVNGTVQKKGGGKLKNPGFRFHCFNKLHHVTFHRIVVLVEHFGKPGFQFLFEKRGV